MFPLDPPERVLRPNKLRWNLPEGFTPLNIHAYYSLWKGSDEEWERKAKETAAAKVHLLPVNAILFTFLHLAPDGGTCRELVLLTRSHLFCILDSSVLLLNSESVSVSTGLVQSKCALDQI